MSKLFNFNSLKTKLTGFSVLILVASILFIGGINLFAISRYIDKQIESQSLQLVNSYAATINHWLKSKQTVISSLKPIVNGDEKEIFNQLVISSNGGAFDQTFVGYADKSHIFSAVRDRPNYDPTSRPWYKGAVAVGGPYVSDPYIGASTQKMLITIADVVNSSGSVQAVVAGDVMMEDVLAVTADIHPTPSSFGFLVGGDGALLSFPDKDSVLKPIDSVNQNLSKAALDEQGLHTILRDREVILFSQPIQNSSWKLVVAVDKKESRAIMGSLFRDYVINTIISSIVAIIILSWGIKFVLARIERIRTAITAAGTGNFSQQIKIESKDELSEIASAYNRFTDNISGTLTKIKETSYFVRNASSEIASGNQDLANRTENLANTLSATISSVESLTRNVLSNTENAKQANQLVDNASEIVDRGGRVMGNVVDMMGNINVSSKKISNIIGVIDSIAFQTNILALNAAVEAARAGEQGRGFAVVASEVRNLAQRSAAAAKEISELINESVENVGSGTRMVENAGETMKEIVQSIQHISHIMTEILAASELQNQEINHINSTITSIESNTQQNTALVEESAAAASSLHDQASFLSDSVDVFTLQQENSHLEQVKLAKQAQQTQQTQSTQGSGAKSPALLGF